MNGEITPIPIRAGRQLVGGTGAEISTEVATVEAPEAAGLVPLAALTPQDALRAAIEREYGSLHQSVEALVSRMYRKWGRSDSREAVQARAEEVLQAVLKRAWARADSYDPTRSAHAWILRFAVNVLQEQERDEWQHKQRRTDLEAARRSEAEASAVAWLERLHDLHQASEAHLSELRDLVSSENWVLIKAAYIDQASGHEMARSLGISDGALRVRLHRATRRLREALQRAEQFGSKSP